MKSKVGIDDVAFALGYQLDRKAGVGRYIELVLPDKNGYSLDRIVVKNPTDKQHQTFFRRDGSGGDVLSFIKENLNLFNVQGNSDWAKVGNVLAQFANAPATEYSSSQYLYNAGYKDTRVFDAARYDITPIIQDTTAANRIFAQRGISQETVHEFAHHIHRIKDLTQSQFNYYNIGFPYTKAGEEKAIGYEIRGFGTFKSKAAGTDSSNGAWIADLSTGKDPANIKNVVFTESAYDAMSFYQANKHKIDKERTVFVSTGGTFSEKQISGVLNHYPAARAVDAFDNDLPGRVYGIRMAGIISGVSMEIVRKDDTMTIKTAERSLTLKENDFKLSKLANDFPFMRNVAEWKAPPQYKDWNDVVRGDTQSYNSRHTMQQRDENLSRSRGI